MLPLSPVAQERESHWLDRFDPRLRLLCALLFALTAVSLQQLPLLLVCLLTGLLLAWQSGLRIGALLRRLLMLEGFMLLLLLTLPFTVPGESGFSIGPLSASWEGLQRALQILLRANAVVLVLLSLIGTLEPVILGHALGQLGLPNKLVHLFLLSVRYIGVLFLEYRRLRTAMRARGFVAGSNRHTWRSFGWLLGMLLVRSLERSQRVLKAMKCRGFHGRLFLLNENRWQPRDSLVLLLVILGCTYLLLLERTL